jgi:outer membrane usher protein
MLNKLFFVFLITVLCVWAQGVCAADAPSSYEALYQKLFKKAYVKTLQVYDANLVVNGKFLGKVRLLADATGPIESLDEKPFLDLLRLSVTELAYQELLGMVSDAVVSERALSLAGYKLSFNRSRSFLVMTVPRDKRTEFLYLDIQGGAWKPSTMASRQKSFSGHVNFKGSAGSLETDALSVAVPLAVDVESVFNMDDFTLRHVGNFQPEDHKKYALADVQVLKDDAMDFTRYVAGDVAFPARGFQGTPRIFGLGIGKLYYLNPQLLDSGNQSVSVKIVNDGVLTLVLNANVLYQGAVEAGTYVIQNIPVAIGVNHLEINVVSPDGTEEKQSKSLIRDIGLIGSGDHEFYYAAGVYSNNNNRAYVLQPEKPVISAYHLYRHDAFWAQGAYVQVDNTQKLLGLESYFPTDVGVFRFDTAYYNAVDSDFGGALDYTTYYDPAGWVGYQRLSVSALGANFRRFGETQKTGISQSLNSDTRLNLSRTTFLGLRAFAQNYYTKTGTYYGGGLTFSQQWEGFLASLGAVYSRSAVGVGEYSLSADAYARLSWNWQASVQVRWQQPKEMTDFVLSYYLTWLPEGGPHTFSAGVQGSDNSRRLDYGYLDNSSGVFMNARTHFSEDRLAQTDVSLGQRNVYSDLQANSAWSKLANTEDTWHSLRYWNTRGLLDVRYNQSKSLKTDSFSRNVSYRLETAVAFADGHMAFSRPIQNNFILVYPEDGLLGRAFTVGDTGLVDMFGPAVITDLPAWSERLMSVGEITDVPEGYDLGALRQRVGVGHYSGQAIRVGNGFRIRVFGSAKTDAGPLAYVACEVFREALPDVVVSRVLTGPDGRFLIQGLEPGSYGFRFNAFTNDVLYFEIADDDSVRAYDMGDLLLSQKEIAPPQE